MAIALTVGAYLSGPGSRLRALAPRSVAASCQFRRRIL